MTATGEPASSGVTLPRRAAGMPSKPGRITSLDWVRGMFLCLSVSSVSVLAPRPDWLEHAPWAGVTFEDTIFPLFVTLSGCGLAFAYRNAVGWYATIRRGVVLLLAGLVYNMIVQGTLSLGELRLTGPLQVYAIIVPIVGILHLIAKKPRSWMIVTAMLAFAQWALLFTWQQRCPGGELVRECNPSRAIDTWLLGTQHMYANGVLGHDPEGIVAILGALVTASVGVTAGHIALSKRHTWRVVPSLVAWAAVASVGGLLSGLTLPTMKRLWTTPFALGVAAIGVMGLTVGMALMDLPAWSRWENIRHKVAWPWVAMGRNSLLVYFGSHILVDVLNAYGDPPWALDLMNTVAFLPNHPRASFVIFMLVIWGGLAMLLHHRKLYLRP